MYMKYKYEIDISHFDMLLVDEIMVKLSEYGEGKGPYKVHIDFGTYIISIECEDQVDFENMQKLINDIIDQK